MFVFAEILQLIRYAFVLSYYIHKLQTFKHLAKPFIASTIKTDLSWNNLFFVAYT